MLPEEKELIRLITNGGECAFGKLFAYYKNRIFSIAFKITRSVSAAEEVMQDVFLIIWHKRKDLAQIQNFDAYLFIVTRNEVYRVLKRKGRHYKTVLLVEENHSITSNETANQVQEKEYEVLLQRAVARLPNQQKQVYLLIKEQGLKREEVADILRVQPVTVKFHLAQAMKSIRTFCKLHLDMFIGFLIGLSELL